MPSGMSRPTTVVDILGALNGASQASNVATTISGVGYIGEVDETSVSSDVATGSVQVPQPWDQAQWSATSWQ